MKNSRWILAVTVTLLCWGLEALAYYHPDEGRWVSRDPIAEHAFAMRYIGTGPADESLHLQKQMLLPPYLFVGNQPVSAFDPYGLATYVCAARFVSLGTFVQFVSMRAHCTSQCHPTLNTFEEGIIRAVFLSVGYSVLPGSWTYANLVMMTPYAMNEVSALSGGSMLNTAGAATPIGGFGTMEIELGMGEGDMDGASTVPGIDLTVYSFSILGTSWVKEKKEHCCGEPTELTF